jgi:hypothetical protein
VEEEQKVSREESMNFWRKVIKNMNSDKNKNKQEPTMVTAAAQSALY